MRRQYPNSRPVATAALIAFWLSCLLPSGTLAQSGALDNWHARFFSPNVPFRAIAYGNGTFVAVGDNGLLATSLDGVQWTRLISAPVMHSTGIIYADHAFYAFGSYGGSTNCIARSTNGQHWATVYEFVGVTPLNSAASGNLRLVFVGSDRIITTTAPPTNWTSFPLPSGTPLSGVTFGLGRFVACGFASGRGYILSSADGLVWRYDYGPDLESAVGGIAFGNGTFVATWRTNSAPEAGVLVSTNLSDWNYVPVLPFFSPVGSIAFGGGHFIASLPGVYTSTSGLSWSNRPTSGTAFAFGQGTFVTVSSAAILQSDVFADPDTQPPFNLALSFYAGVSVVGEPGQPYRIEIATNLSPEAVWLPLTNLTLPHSPYLWIDPATPTTPQRFYRARQLE